MTNRFSGILLLLLWLSSGVAFSQSVTLSIPDLTVESGSTILVPVSVSELVSGDQVLSGEWQFTVSSNIAAITGVETNGTLLQGRNIIFNETNREFAFSSTDPITGSGTLLFLQVVIAPDAEKFQESIIGITSARFNEGLPAIDTISGTLRIKGIALTPKSPSPPLVEGQTFQFNLSGDIAEPVTWTSSNTAIATVSSTGLATGITSGSVKIFVVDAEGQRDSTDLFRVEPSTLLDLTVGVNDVSVTQTLEGQVGVQVSDLTGLNITSGEISLSYTDTKLEIISYSTAGTLLEGIADPVINEVNNTITFAFAGATPLEGSGSLLDIQFRVLRNATGTASFSPTSARFNETIDAALAAGTVTILDAPVIEVQQSDDEITIGETTQFSVLSGGTPPYTWRSSNTEVADIDVSTGLATGLRRGTVEIVAIDSENFESAPQTLVVNDVTVSFPDTDVSSLDIFTVPLQTTDITGLGVNSFEAEILFDPTILQFEGVDQAGTLSDGYSLSLSEDSGTIRIAAAGTANLADEGAILNLQFSVLSGTTLGTVTEIIPVSLTFNEPGPDTPTATLRPGSVSYINSTLPEQVILLSPPDGAIDISLLPEVSWQNAAGADSYEVQISTTADYTGIVESQTGITGTLYQVVNQLNELTTYYWRVRASNTSGTGPWSSSFSFTTRPGLPESPVLTSPADGAINVPVNTVFNWEASQFSDEYVIEISEQSDFSLIAESAPVSALTYQAQTLLFNTLYYWRVSGVNSQGTGTPSATFSFTTEQEPVNNIDPAASTVTATTPHVADGTDASLVTVSLVYTNGDPAAGLAANQFDVALTGSAVAGTVTETGTPGTYTFDVTNTVAESVTVTITADGVVLDDTPSIVFEAPILVIDPEASTVTATTPHTADGTDASQVTVSLVYTNGDPAAGLAVNLFNVSLTGSAVAGPVTETATQGTYSFEVTNTVAEQVTVTVTADGVAISDTPIIVFNEPLQIPDPPVLTDLVETDQGVEVQWEAISEEFTSTYIIYRGNDIGNLQEYATVNSGTFAFPDNSLPAGIFVYAVSARNSEGGESSLSLGKSYINTELVADSDWNLVSIPLASGSVDADLATLFSYDNQYSVETSLVPGRGYWVKTRSFDIENYPVAGNGLEQALIPLNAGWNLIGSLSDTITSGEISDPGNILSDAPLFSFSNNQYETADRLIPGSGYWIHANQPGEIEMQLNLNPNPQFQADDSESVLASAQVKSAGLFAESIVFRNAGYSVSLAIPDYSLHRDERVSFLLPPTAPDVSLDIRTSDDYSIIQFNTETVLQLSADEFPVTVEYEGESGTMDGSLSVKVQYPDSEIQTNLSAGQSFEIHENPEYLSVMRLSGEETVQESELIANYPNPFNPATTIHYRLQNTSYVKIEVFDIAGRKVGVLADGIMQSGEYRVQFNAQNLASGIYIVRFQNENNLDLRKITLIK